MIIICDNERNLKTSREFQDRVSDINQDEMTCMRFLVARDFNIAKAEEMIRKNQVWRKSNGIDRILEWKIPEDIVKGFPFEILNGMSKNNCPVVWIPGGLYNTRYFVEQGRKDDWIRYGFAILEKILIQLKEIGGKRIIGIMDLEGLTYHKVAHLETHRATQSFYQACEQNYPEILEKIIIINAPWVYRIAYSFVKPILAPQTRAKLEVYGSDQSEWLPVLRNICGEEILPKKYLMENFINNK